MFFVFNDQVLYWTDDSKKSVIGKIRVSGNVTTKNITGLKANTVYFASVRAYNTAGTGPSSPPANGTTKKSRKYISHCRDQDSPTVRNIPLLNFHFILTTSSFYWSLYLVKWVCPLNLDNCWNFLVTKSKWTVLIFLELQKRKYFQYKWKTEYNGSNALFQLEFITWPPILGLLSGLLNLSVSRSSSVKWRKNSTYFLTGFCSRLKQIINRKCPVHTLVNA